MIKVEIIGNLGADAEIKEGNGRKFVSFRVAHTDKWKDQTTGLEHSSTTWASCAINGDGGNLLQYLKKGAKVFLRGSMSLNIYSSPKTHQMEVGLNVSVWEIELCGGAKEENAPQQPSVTAKPSTNVAPEKKK